MQTTFSQDDRLRTVATELKKRGRSPDDNCYRGQVTTICNHLYPSMSSSQIADLARKLTTNYRLDGWAYILGIEPEQKPPTATQEITFALQKYRQTNTNKKDASILHAIANRDTFEGVGRLAIKEIQIELGMTTQEIMELWRSQYDDPIEQDGNALKIYWGGKEKIEEKRSQQPIRWNPQRPTVKAEASVASDALHIGEVFEDTEGTVRDPEREVLDDEDGIAEDTEELEEG